MELHFQVEGEGPAIVLIHGLSDNLLYWEPVSSALKNSYTVIRLDLRGHGQSELGRDKITLDLLTDDLKNLLDDLNIKKAHLIGFSLGGAIAMNFAVKFPDKISSLVLMSTFCKCDDYVVDIFNKFKNALNDSFEEFYDLILPMTLCPDVIENNKTELEIIKETASKTANCQAYIKACDACLDFDIEGKLSQINVSTLILAGKYDEISLLTHQENLHRNINNSQFVVLDNLKHNLLVGKNIVEILSLLEKFLKKE